MVLGSSPVAVTSLSDFAAASSKEFLDIQATIERGFTLKRVRNMTRTYSHNFYPSQHFNFGSALLQNCNNVDLALKTKQNSRWIFSVAQRWYNVGVRRWNNISQRWYNSFSTLCKVVSKLTRNFLSIVSARPQNSPNCMDTNLASDKNWFADRLISFLLIHEKTFFRIY